MVLADFQPYIKTQSEAGDGVPEYAGLEQDVCVEYGAVGGRFSSDRGNPAVLRGYLEGATA